MAWLLLAAAGAVIVFQTVRVFDSYSKTWVATVWKHRALSSYDRSALFMLKPGGASYLRFLNAAVVPTAPFVLPEGAGRFSEQSTLQFFLMPHKIPGCGCDPSLFPQADGACVACLQHPSHVVPALRQFPPGDVDLTGKVFIPYEGEGEGFRGVYVPADAVAQPGVLAQPAARAIWQAIVIDALLLAGLLLPGSVACALLLPRAGLEEVLCLGWPLGLALTTWLTFLLSWAGARVSLGLFIVAWGAWLLVLGVILRRTRGIWPHEIMPGLVADARGIKGHASVVNVILVTAAAFLLAQMVVISVGRGYSLFDAIANWALKGYAIAQEGTIWAGKDWGGHGLAYPQNLHLAISLFRLADGDALPGSKLLDPLLLSSMLMGCFRFWKRTAVPSHLALGGAVVILSVPLIFFHGTIGYANLLYTAYLTLGSLWVLEGLAEDRPQSSALGSLLLGCAAWTRPEGAITAAVQGLSIVLAGRVVLGRKVRPAYTVLPFAVLAGTWLAFGLPHIRADGGGGLISTFFVDLAVGRQGLTPFFRLVDFATKRLLLPDKWGLLFPLILLLLLIGIPRGVRRGWTKIAPLVVFMIVGFALPVAVLTAVGYSWTPAYLDDAFDRAWLPAALAVFVGAWQLAASGLGPPKVAGVADTQK